MSVGSHFSQLSGEPREGAASAWRRDATGALDAVGFILPISLGSAALVASRIGPGLLPQMLFATIVALALVHLMNAANARPLCYAARFFEAAALAAMLDRSFASLPAWGLPDTLGVRLAILCLTGAGAGLWVGVLYLLRANRFTRFIPAPVFAGFANSIAVALLISQSRSLWQLATAPGGAAPALTCAIAALGTALAVRRWRPGLPASALGLGIGLLLGLAWSLAGHGTPLVGHLSFGMPVALADFDALRQAGVMRAELLRGLAINAAILGTMIFINTTMAAQQLTQQDGRRSNNALGMLFTSFAMTLAGALGAAPVSGSSQASNAAVRVTGFSPRLLVGCALALALFHLSSVLGWIPIAALAGALFAEAWFMTDRRSLRLAADWLRRQPLPTAAREDLALIVSVTVVAVLLNMVAAVFTGLLLGLVMFAARNARRPVRRVWTGAQMHSNCARPRNDLRTLAHHGDAIRVCELEGHLFFGTADTLERTIRASFSGAECVILDWARVRDVDSSAAQAVALAARIADREGIPMLHAVGHASEDVQAVLRAHLADPVFAADLDRALEVAENRVLQMHTRGDPNDVTAFLEAASLFSGLSPQERDRLEKAMPQKLVPAGERLLGAGDPADELMLVMSGSAGIMLPLQDGRDLRVASVRRGATIGEIGFLDRAPRSASVVAQEDTCVAVLTRRAWDELCESEPRLVRQVLANLALDIATRLRHTNQLALARQHGA